MDAEEDPSKKNSEVKSPQKIELEIVLLLLTKNAAP